MKRLFLALVSMFLTQAVAAADFTLIVQAVQESVNSGRPLAQTAEQDEATSAFQALFPDRNDKYEYMNYNLDALKAYTVIGAISSTKTVLVHVRSRSQVEVILVARTKRQGEIDIGDQLFLDAKNAAAARAFEINQFALNKMDLGKGTLVDNVVPQRLIAKDGQAYLMTIFDIYNPKKMSTDLLEQIFSKIAR
jgi:hypothetical protein